MLRFRQVKTATLTLLLCGTANAQSGPLISFLILLSACLKLRLPGGERIHQALRGRVPNSLFFPLPLSSLAAEISSSVHTMVLSTIVFNTKGPTIAPMDLDVGLVEGGGVHFVPAWVMVFCLFLLG